jgi:hypothetical protein
VARQVHEVGVRPALDALAADGEQLRAGFVEPSQPRQGHGVGCARPEGDRHVGRRVFQLEGPLQRRFVAAETYAAGHRDPRRQGLAEQGGHGEAFRLGDRQVGIAQPLGEVARHRVDERRAQVRPDQEFGCRCGVRLRRGQQINRLDEAVVVQPGVGQDEAGRGPLRTRWHRRGDGLQQCA